jgi:hypothetical protein
MRCRARSQAAGFQEEDLTPCEPVFFEKRERDVRCFPGSWRGLQDGGCPLGKRRTKVRERFVYWK